MTGERATGSGDALSRAVEHVNINWIPVDLERVEELIQTGDSSIIQQDITIFLSLLRHSAQSGSLNGPSGEIDEFKLRAAPEILRRREWRSSAHKPERVSEFQFEQLAFVKAVAASVQLIGRSWNLTEDSTTCAAAIRQLGLILIAFNYPRIFERARERAETLRELHDELSYKLGFSPAMLAAAVLESWDAPSSYVEIAKGEVNVASPAVPLLIKLCRAGEVFAAMENPDYPQPLPEEWSEAKELVQNYLGVTGIGHLRAHVAVTLSRVYAKQKFFSTEPASIVDLRNPWVEKLPERYKPLFQEFYQRLKPNEIGRENIEFLLKKVAPASGFSGAIVYLLEVESERLIKRMATGEIRTPYPAQIDTLNPASFSFVSSALSSSSPKVRASEEGVMYASSLGTEIQTGVIVLNDTDNSPVSERNTVVQALARALTEALLL